MEQDHGEISPQQEQSAEYNEAQFEADFEARCQKSVARSKSLAPLLKDRREALALFFNNFYFYLPGGLMRKALEGDRRDYARAGEEMPHKERFAFRERQYNEMDVVIQKLGLDFETVSKLTAISPDYRLSPEGQEVLKRLYIEMRKLGYTHTDLVG